MADKLDRQVGRESSPSNLLRSPELMRAEDTLLLVVDMQEKLLAAQPESRRIVWNCRRLIDAANILGVRVTATEQVPNKLGSTTAVLAERLPMPCDAKQSFSCCTSDALTAVLNEAGIERVLLCGIETHVCIGQTACDLLAGGYQVLVTVDAVGSRNAIDHEVALRRLELSGALLTTTEAAMFEWCESAERPEFRQISALAKESLGLDE